MSLGPLRRIDFSERWNDPPLRHNLRRKMCGLFFFYTYVIVNPVS